MSEERVVYDHWFDFSNKTALETLAADVAQCIERWFTELGLAISGGRFPRHQTIVNRECVMHLGREPFSLAMRLQLGGKNSRGVSVALTDDGAVNSGLGLNCVAIIKPQWSRMVVDAATRSQLLSVCSIALLAVQARLAAASKAKLRGTGADKEQQALDSAFRVSGEAIALCVQVSGHGREPCLNGRFIRRASVPKDATSAHEASASGLLDAWSVGSVSSSSIPARHPEGWTSLVTSMAHVAGLTSKCLDLTAGPGVHNGAAVWARRVRSWVPSERTGIQSQMQPVLGVLEAAVVGGAYWGKALVKPDADKLREWLWRVPGGLWRSVDGGALRSAAVTATGTPAAEAAVRHAHDPIADVDPVTAGLTVVNGIEPLWGPLTRDPVAGMSLQLPVDASNRSGATIDQDGLLWIRWAGGTSMSRVNTPPAPPLPDSDELDTAGLPILASLHELAASDAVSSPHTEAGGGRVSRTNPRWIVPAEDTLVAANVLERDDTESTPRTPDHLDADAEEADDASDESDESDDDLSEDEPVDPASASASSAAAADSRPVIGGFRVATDAESIPLSAEAAVRRCRALIDTDTPLAVSCLGFIRALRQVMLTHRGKTAATTVAKEELTAAVGTAELHGVPENGILGSMMTAASSARSDVHARREASKRDASLLRATSEFITGRPGDTGAAGLRQKLILRSSRLTRQVRKKASSVLVRTPGAGRLAGTLAAATSFTSSVTSAMLGDDPLPPSTGVLSALAVLFDGVPSLPDTAGAAKPGEERPIKGSTPGDLASRLAVLASRMRGPRGIAVVWNAFVTELQSRWDHQETLPHMLTGDKVSSGSPQRAATDKPPTPDLQMGLLAQKLSMLQWCIASLHSGPITSPSVAGTTQDLMHDDAAGGKTAAARLSAAEDTDPTSADSENEKSAVDAAVDAIVAATAAAGTPRQSKSRRQQQQPHQQQTAAAAESFASPATDDSMHTASGMVDADEEGWEVSGLDLMMSPEAKADSAIVDDSRVSAATDDRAEEAHAPVPSIDPESVSNRRDGHKRALVGMCLLQTGLQMMEPHTQVAAAFTEDTLRERQDLMARVGSIDGSSALLAKTHIAGLKSDMSAFKAANPTCCFGDFIRWYSPNDWVRIPGAGASMESGGRGEEEEEEVVADEEMTVRADATDTHGMLSTRFASLPPVIPGVDDVELAELDLTMLESAVSTIASAEAARRYQQQARRQRDAPISTGSGFVSDGDAAAAKTDTGPQLETLWLEAWRHSPSKSASRQAHVVPVEFQGTLALDYLIQLPMQDLLVLLFAVSASNAAHILQHAVPAAISLSAQCRAKVTMACKCLRQAASTASNFVLAEFTPETVASAAHRPIAARDHVNRTMRARLGRVIGDACVAVCAVADAETTLSRFVAVSNHLDAWQSASSITWRTASALLSRPSSSSTASPPQSSSLSESAAADAEELQDSTKAAAILCGGYVAPTQLASTTDTGSSSEICAARVAADCLREDAAFFPDSCHSAYGSTPTSFLVPPVPVADPTHPSSSFLWSTHSHLDLGLDDAGDDEQGFEDAQRALDEDPDRTERSSTQRSAPPRLGSILRAGASRKAIRQLQTSLGSIHHEVDAAELPSQRLCMLLNLTKQETALAASVPAIIDTPVDEDERKPITASAAAQSDATRRSSPTLQAILPSQPTSALEVHLRHICSDGSLNHVSAIVSDGGTRIFAAVTERL